MCLLGLIIFLSYKKMFEQCNIFSGSELCTLNIFWGDSQVALEFKTACEVESVPERWERYQQEYSHAVYVYLTLHCITAFEGSLVKFGFSPQDPLRVILGKIEPGQSENTMELVFEDNQWLKIKYKVGRIQNTSNKPRNL